jgi:hypothetical protein
VWRRAEMKAWIRTISRDVAKIYLSTLEWISIVYLAAYIPIDIAARFMKWFSIGHIEERADDEAFNLAIVLTIFLVVRKIARDTDEIKKRIQS